MLKYIEEDRKYVEITGFRGIRVEDAEALLTAVRRQMPQQAEVQFFDADLVATWQHLYFAVLNALMTFRTQRNVSKNLAVEVMLYASAQRQIKKAIAILGVNFSSANIAAVIISGSAEGAKAALSAVSKYLGVIPDETVLELSAAKTQGIKHSFGIAEVELESVAAKAGAAQALVDLVVERVALLATRL